MPETYMSITALPLQKCSADFVRQYDNVPDSEFAVVLHNATGDGSVRLLPIPDEVHVKISAAYLKAASPRLPSGFKEHAWARIAQRARDLGNLDQIKGYLSGAKIAKLSESVPGPDLWWSQISEEASSVRSVLEERQKQSSSTAHQIKVSFAPNPYLSRNRELILAVSTHQDLVHLGEMAGNEKLSSATRRQAAQHFREVWGRFYAHDPLDSHAELPSGVLEMAGTKVSSVKSRELKFYDRDNVQPNPNCPVTLYTTHWHDYRGLLHEARTSEKLSEVQAEVLALKISSLEEILGVTANSGEPLSPIHGVLFDPAAKTAQGASFDGEADERVMYVNGAIFVRERHVKQLPMLRIKAFEDLWGKEFVEKLRTSPLKTFEGADDSVKKVLATFLIDQLSNWAAGSRPIT